MIKWPRLLRYLTRNRRVPADAEQRARYGTWGWLTGRGTWEPSRGRPRRRHARAMLVAIPLFWGLCCGVVVGVYFAVLELVTSHSAVPAVRTFLVATAVATTALMVPFAYAVKRHVLSAAHRYGDCTVTRNGDGTLTVRRADPRIDIAADLLEKIAAGEHHPAVALTGDPDRIAACARGQHHSEPDFVLTIAAANRTVVYRIAAYVRRPGVYVGSLQAGECRGG